jgi:hypothetical protein
MAEVEEWKTRIRYSRGEYGDLKNHLQAALADEEVVRFSNILETFRDHGVAVPRFVVSSIETAFETVSDYILSSPFTEPSLDTDAGWVRATPPTGWEEERERAPLPHVEAVDWNLVNQLSELVEVGNFKLPDLVAIWRGESSEDPRPNKALRPELWGSLDGFPDVEKLVALARCGYIPHFKEDPITQDELVANHGGAIKLLNVLVNNIGKDQRTGRSLVLHSRIAKRWLDLRSSPLSVVPKKDQDPSLVGRTINDLKSYPHINSATDQNGDIRRVGYQPISHLAEEVLRVKNLGRGCSMMAGDVEAAFRHIPVHRDYCKYFASSVSTPGLLVIDLFCCFGWTESPRAYDLAGGAISFIHSLDGYFSHYWVDDHVSVESGDIEKQKASDQSLRRAMMTVLGPFAMNEKKFTSWSDKLQVLGLQFDTVAGTVSMPPHTIAKTRGRISDMLARGKANYLDLQKILGSLRHVSTCIRPVSGFIQKLAMSLKATPNYRIPMSDGAICDLNWLSQVVDKTDLLKGICLEYFVHISTPDVEIHMDASDTGLCAIDMVTKKYLQLEFNAAERAQIASDELSINVRELWSAVFAALCWWEEWKGEQKRPRRIEFIIDNSSAVSWANTLASRNPIAQDMLRILCFLEIKGNLRFTARHIAGVDNDMADAGSRFRDEERVQRFTLLTRGYVQTEISDKMRSPSNAWSSLSAKGL